MHITNDDNPCLLPGDLRRRPDAEPIKKGQLISTGNIKKYFLPSTEYQSEAIQKNNALLTIPDQRVIKMLCLID